MPHLIVDYSTTLDDRADMQALLKRLHDVACTLPTIDPHSVKSRLSPRSHALVGQAGPDALYAHVQFSLLNGRTLAVRQQMRDELAAILTDILPSATDLAVEIRQMEKDTYFKQAGVA
ncbi:MAG: hypothetical protein V4621_03750 [Pseudomonadota bacterium]